MGVTPDVLLGACGLFGTRDTVEMGGGHTYE
jgi:hypothetical protein